MTGTAIRMAMHQMRMVVGMIPAAFLFRRLLRPRPRRKSAREQDLEDLAFDQSRLTSLCFASEQCYVGRL